MTDCELTAWIKGVIFDLDGTLSDTVPLCVAAFRKAIEPYAERTISDEEIIATFGPSEEGTIHALAPDHAEACLEDYLRHYADLHDAWPSPFDGITDLLTDLQAQGVRLALVTGKGPKSTVISLRRLELKPFFEYVETGSPHGPRKPDGIRQIVAHWGLEPSEVVYVGDAPSDVHSARAAGTAVVAAAWAATYDRSDLAALNPDAILDSVAELETWLTSRLVTLPDVR